MIKKNVVMTIFHDEVEKRGPRWFKLYNDQKQKKKSYKYEPSALKIAKLRRKELWRI